MFSLFSIFFNLGGILSIYLFFRYVFVCTYNNYRVYVRLFGVILIFDIPFSDIIYCDTAFNVFGKPELWSRINVQMSFSLNLNRRLFIVTKNSSVFAYTISPKNTEEFLRKYKECVGEP